MSLWMEYGVATAIVTRHVEDMPKNAIEIGCSSVPAWCRSRGVQYASID